MRTSSDSPEMTPHIRNLIDDRLARWDRIQHREASLSLQLTYADALARLGKVQEAQEAYHQIELSLENLRGVASDILRLRWANLWGYFVIELMGKPHVAQKAYAILRAQMDLNAETLQSERMALLDTEFNIEWRLGRYDSAKILVDELLAVARRNHNPRIEARAWNSMGITKHALGLWHDAAECYENAIRLGRSIGERRLEAIGLHNLGLVLMDQGNYEQARHSQERYLELSRSIGNYMAESYAPAYLGFIELLQGNFKAAEEQIAHSLKLAEENQWQRLVGLNHAFGALLLFYQWIASSRPEMLSQALQAFEQAESGWLGLDEAGEFYASYALASHLVGDTQTAREILERAHKNVDESWVTARLSLEVADAIVAGRPFQDKLGWFKDRGFARWVDFIEKVTA